MMSDQRFEKFLKRQLVYEVRMLRATHDTLLREPTNADDQKAIDQKTINALIESFATHARNLFEFFTNETKDASDQPAARHFAPRAYPVRHRDPSRSARMKAVNDEMISVQISHLRYSRPTDPADKIGQELRREIRDLVEAELTVFEGNLAEHHLTIWREANSAKSIAKLATWATTEASMSGFDWLPTRINREGGN